MIKNTLPFLLLFIAIFESFAQKNVVKVNLLSLPLGNANLAYERVLTDKKSISLAVSYFPSRNLLFKDAFTSGSSSTANADNMRWQNLKMSGMSITPEFRFYTARRKEAPRGFYLAPYLKYQNINFKGNYIKTYYDDDYQRNNTANFNLSGKYNVFAVGCQFGIQWLIADRFSIDWSFIGLGFGSYKLNLKESSTQVGPNYYSTNGEGSVNVNDVPFGTAKYTYTKTSGEGSITTVLPHLRTGLSIGFAF